MNSVFEVKHIMRRLCKVSGKGDARLFEENLGIFSTLKKAEAYILNSIVKDISIGFIVYERAVDTAAAGPWHTKSYFESTRNYDENGKPICFSDFDDACRKVFRGRKKKDTPFHVGDTVIVRNSRNDYRVGIIDQLPVSKCKKGDYSDDCYLVVYSDGSHSHPVITDVFMNSIMMTGGFKEKLNKAFAEYNRED